MFKEVSIPMGTEMNHRGPSTYEEIRALLTKEIQEVSANYLREHSDSYFPPENPPPLYEMRATLLSRVVAYYGSFLSIYLCIYFALYLFEASALAQNVVKLSLFPILLLLFLSLYFGNAQKEMWHFKEHSPSHSDVEIDAMVERAMKEMLVKCSHDDVEASLVSRPLKVPYWTLLWGNLSTTVLI